ncbi:MAG: TlyA family RNA methyltransferase [Chloroflexi bacterium]|nr:TlyA family RNA methyltransferase [Chloroflexota bacterium]
MTKQRLDTLLVDKGLAESPEKARALVMAGQVLVDDRPAPKPGTMIDDSLVVQLSQRPRYVGRGGEKLEHALQVFNLDVTRLIAADIGASTGGFTDCLLQHGAAKVYAIDVGRGQLDYGLRNDPRVVVMEGVNARELQPLPELVGLVTADVSFISLKLVLPPARSILTEDGSIVALFKPQFEAAKDEVPRGGVIRDPLLRSTLIGRFVAWCVSNGFRVLDLAASPITGADGNQEFLFWLRPKTGQRSGS